MYKVGCILNSAILRYCIPRDYTVVNNTVKFHKHGEPWAVRRHTFVTSNHGAEDFRFLSC